VKRDAESKLNFDQFSLILCKFPELCYYAYKDTLFSRICVYLLATISRGRTLRVNEMKIISNAKF